MVQETTTEVLTEEVQEMTAERSEHQRTKETTPTMTENDQEEVMVHAEKEDLQPATTASKKVISPETATNQEKRELKELPHAEKEDLWSATTASKKVMSPETATNQEKKELKELETVVAREETTTEVAVVKIEVIEAEEEEILKPELKVATTKLQESEMHELV